MSLHHTGHSPAPKELLVMDRMADNQQAGIARALALTPAGKTCGGCWRFRGCSQKPETPNAVACRHWKANP